MANRKYTHRRTLRINGVDVPVVFSDEIDEVEFLKEDTLEAFPPIFGVIQERMQEWYTLKAEMQAIKEELEQARFIEAVERVRRWEF